MKSSRKVSIQRRSALWLGLIWSFPGLEKSLYLIWLSTATQICTKPCPSQLCERRSSFSTQIQSVEYSLVSRKIWLCWTTCTPNRLRWAPKAWWELWRRQLHWQWSTSGYSFRFYSSFFTQSGLLGSPPSLWLSLKEPTRWSEVRFTRFLRWSSMALCPYEPSVNWAFSRSSSITSQSFQLIWLSHTSAQFDG